MENRKEKLGERIKSFASRNFKTSKNWVLGKLFEIVRNDTLNYRGLTFSFDNSYIQTKEKANLLFGLHSYEEHPILYAEKHLDKSLALIELGGCNGIVSCITDKMIGTPHIVVEANPLIIPALEKNKKINNCHFTIVNKALAYEKNVDYYVSRNPVDSGLYKKTSQKISVQGTTLQDLSENFDRINLLVDIEGAEIDLIDHEIDLISAKVAVLIIEFHPLLSHESEVKRITEKLEKSGLKCAEKDENDAVFINSR